MELQGLCFYTLCVINRSANGATEAAIKYFIIGGLTSCLLLFGTTNLNNRLLYFMAWDVLAEHYQK